MFILQELFVQLVGSTGLMPNVWHSSSISSFMLCNAKAYMGWEGMTN